MLKMYILLIWYCHKITPPCQSTTLPSLSLSLFLYMLSFTISDSHTQVRKIRKIICLWAGYCIIVYYVFSFPEAAGIDYWQK